MGRQVRVPVGLTAGQATRVREPILPGLSRGYDRQMTDASNL